MIYVLGLCFKFLCSFSVSFKYPVHDPLLFTVPVAVYVCVFFTLNYTVHFLSLEKEVETIKHFLSH